jgi:hypothetical protein
MTEEPARAKLRVSLISFPERYALPSRPAGVSPPVLDAYRQTQFLLNADLALFERAMNLQLKIVAANSKARTTRAAALFAFWSRAFSHLADACTLLSTGSYVSCAPLLRAACDCIAAQRSAAADDFAEYEGWFEGAIQQDREHAATAFDLGRFRAGSMLAQDERLGSAYRLLTDLSMPHFGATALQTAPASNLQKLAISFADGGFHLAWAELIVGWLLTLADTQIVTISSSGVFAVDHATLEDFEGLSREIGAVLSSTRRCYVEEAAGRFLFHNYRRTSTGAPKRLML